VINEEDTYDFVCADGRIKPKIPKEESVPLSIKLHEEIKELQNTLAFYKDANKKLIVEKNLLLQIINTSGR